jgi:hypothetical protein
MKQESESALPDTVTIPEGVVWQEIDDGIVLLNIDAGNYHGLNDVASQMWVALEDSPDVATAYERLRDLFEVDEKVLREDLAEFIDRLLAEGILTTP